LPLIAADNSPAAKPEAKPAVKSAAQIELQDLITKVQAKIKASKTNEQDMAEELRQFDALLAQHANEKTDDVAQILFMKALLYIQVFDNTEKGVALVKKMKTDFPDTKQGKSADDFLTNVERQAEEIGRASCRERE